MPTYESPAGGDPEHSNAAFVAVNRTLAAHGTSRPSVDVTVEDIDRAALSDMKPLAELASVYGGLSRR